MTVKFLYMGSVLTGKVVGKEVGTNGLINKVEVTFNGISEVWKVEESSCLATKDGELADSVTEPAPIIQVFYEKGYRWTVQVSNQDESYESNITKGEAMSLAKMLQDRTGWKIEAQTLTKAEKKQVMVDRWDHVKSIGQDTLQRT